MEDKPLELRMYFFVPYNISPIQQAIQAGHSALEYAHYFGDTGLFKDFIENWKTWVILNGGTTSNKIIDNKHFGSLNQIKSDIISFNFNHRNNINDIINYSDFYEPDLNDALTAVCFICDERVFNRKDYPDFKQYFLDKVSERYGDGEANRLLISSEEQLIAANPSIYKLWIEFLGGEKNVFLRNLIKDKKLV